MQHFLSLQFKMDLQSIDTHGLISMQATIFWFLFFKTFYHFSSTSHL